MTETRSELAARLAQFSPGQRVQMHPATDLWMRGARYGTVIRVGRRKLLVKLDMIPTPRRVIPDNLLVE